MATKQDQRKYESCISFVLVGFGAGFTWAACKIHIEGGKHDDQSDA